MAEIDYAQVIDAEDYTQGLAEHPDIPQSDAGIIRVIRERFQSSNGPVFRVLDLGCGPGRITKPIADELASASSAKDINISVTGLDVSEGFISFAREHKSAKSISYVQADFLKHEFPEQFDVIVMQGLFHHVPLTDRHTWAQKCLELLTPTGVVVIGDEFVPDYSSDAERVINVAGLYAYVIAYALQNGHRSLSQIESMNMVDDVCAGLPGAGHSTPELLGFIQDASAKFYAKVYAAGVQNEEAKKMLADLVQRIQLEAGQAASNQRQNHNRGDYKISVPKQVDEMAAVGLKLKSKHIYGPVKWMGGMGVLVFGK